uniref:Aldo_ket_red domain-containing protein n=1 Tax=Panagrellus redivivus TaxID=6233 RepID=A0A7E4VPX5_PANRE
MSTSKTLTFSNGVQMPLLGIGTSTLFEALKESVKAAVRDGYRLIDTAEKLLAEGVVKREDLFITTKCAPQSLVPENQEAALRESLRKLRLDYVDLYLAHQAGAFDPDNTTQRHDVTVEDVWKSLEKLYEKKLTRAIGVSNYSVSQIEHVLKIAKVPIHNIQIELHLYFQQKAIVQLCDENKITVTAYAPFGSPGRMKFTPNGETTNWPIAASILEDKEVVVLAEKYKKTPGQILLRHLIQKGIAVIPKSANPKRIEDNNRIWDFELSPEEVEKLDGAPQTSRLFWQSFLIGHPEDPFNAECERKRLACPDYEMLRFCRPSFQNALALSRHQAIVCSQLFLNATLFKSSIVASSQVPMSSFRFSGSAPSSSRRHRPDHEFDNDLVTKEPFFGFPKEDSHLERIIVTNLYDTKVWSEKTKMFAPPTKNFAQYTVHPIKASVTAAVPNKLLSGVSRDFPQKDIAWLVIPFSPEYIRTGLQEKIVDAANLYGYKNKVRLINVRDALFMGVAYAQNVDMPMYGLCLFVIINDADFHVTVYYRTVEGYKPIIERVIPYDIENPEVAANTLKPLSYYLKNKHTTYVATFMKEEPSVILKHVFGDSWFVARMDRADDFYHQHLCIAGGVVKGRNLIGVKHLNYYNVIECCPYDFQVRSAYDEVLLEFMAAHRPLPLDLTGEAMSTSEFLKIYIRDSCNPEWIHIRTVVVDRELEIVKVSIAVDINCGHTLFIDDKKPLDYSPILLNREGYHKPENVVMSTLEVPHEPEKKQTPTKKSKKETKAESPIAPIKPIDRPIPKDLILLKSEDPNADFVYRDDNFIELCYCQSKFHFRLRFIGKPAHKIPIKIRNQTTIHCSMTILNSVYLFGENSVRMCDTYRKQTLHSFVDYLGRSYKDIMASGAAMQPCLVPSKRGENCPAEVQFQGQNNERPMRAQLHDLLGCMIMHIKTELEKELNIVIDKLAFNPANAFNRDQHELIAKLFAKYKLTYLNSDGSVYSG